MPESARVTLSEIATSDVAAVAQFLHHNLNARLSAARWADAITPGWSVLGPNHGFKLEADGVVVGVNIAFYSVRPDRPAGTHRTTEPEKDQEARRVCNVAALCVRPEARAHAVRLIRALTRQAGWIFTDLSPSHNVVEIDRRLGFQPLDTTTAAVVNLPGRRSRDLHLRTEPEEIGAFLADHDPGLFTVFSDHRSAHASHHLLLEGSGVLSGRFCYLVYRRDRRKRLPIFASILFASDPGLYLTGIGAVAGHLLSRGALVTLVERRLLQGRRPSGFGVLFSARPKLYKGSSEGSDDVDYLYSELTCVPW